MVRILHDGKSLARNPDKFHSISQPGIYGNIHGNVDDTENKYLCHGIEDGRIVAAYIMNHDRDEAYHAVKWLIEANDNETVVLHLR